MPELWPGLSLRVHDRQVQVRALRQRAAAVRDQLGLKAGDAVECGCIDDGKIELLFGCAQPVEQIEDLVQHPMRACAGPGDRARTIATSRAW